MEQKIRLTVINIYAILKTVVYNFLYTFVMKYLDFRQFFKDFTVITCQDIKNVFGKVNNAQLIGWQKKGLLAKVKRGMFILPDEKNDLHIIANELNYSYISLEYALSYYQIIPDIARVITSVSKNRNEKIQNSLGFFYYRKITGKLFTGYTLIKSARGSRMFKMAAPEKALFDLVYFRSDLNKSEDFKSLRLSLPPDFKIKEIEKYARAVKAFQIKNRLNKLIKYLYDDIQ